MAKIKGWTKQYDSGEKIGWRGTNTTSFVQIRKDGFWYVSASLHREEDRTKKNRDISKQFKTKKEALAYAIKYMKAHPRG